MKRHTNLSEAIAIRDLLTQHLHRSELKNEEGVHVWCYDEGWDDTKIATTVAPDLARQHTKRVRDELFGPVGGAVRPPKPKAPRSPDKSLEIRVSQLERVVRHLCDSLGVPFDCNTGT